LTLQRGSGQVLLRTSPPVPFGASWRIDLLPGRGATVRLVGERGGWLEVESAVQSVDATRVWEVSVPLATFGLSLGARVGVAAALAREGNIMETLPAEAAHTFTLAEISGVLGKVEEPSKD